MIRASMRHDVETIRTLVSFTHKLFYTRRRKWSIAIGIVLILAFAFKDKLIELVKNLWNNLLKQGDESTSQGDVVTDWN